MPAPTQPVSEKQEPSLSDATTLNTFNASSIDLEAGSLDEKWIGLMKLKGQETYVKGVHSLDEKYNETDNVSSDNAAAEPDLESGNTNTRAACLTVARTAISTGLTRIKSCTANQGRCGCIFTRHFSWGFCWGIRCGNTTCHPLPWIAWPLAYMIPFGTLCFLLFGLPILLDKRSPEEKKAAAAQVVAEWSGIW